MGKSISTCYWSGWRKIFDYKGSATRKEFWSFIVVNVIFALLVGLVCYAFGAAYSGSGYGVVSMIILFFITILCVVFYIGSGSFCLTGCQAYA